MRWKWSFICNVFSCSVLNQIPSDPLSALDINLQLLYESSLRRIARDIATRVLKSAFKYVNNFASWRNRNENNGKESEGVEDVECIPSIIPSDCVDITSNVSLLLPNDSEDIENDITDMNEEQFLRKVAQKLVRKIIHSACTRLEPLSRVDSIEELVTDTKRLRLTFSPSYTPPLQPEEIKESTGQPQLAVNRAGNVINNRLSPNSGVFSIGSQAGLQECKNNRKKRQRSASHEANMEKDMEKIRLKFQTNVQISDGQESVKTSSAEATSTVLLTGQQRSVTNIVSDIRKMSIMEVEEQENVTHNEEEDDDYTVLEAVTKPMISPLPDLKVTDFSSNRLKDTKISLENLPTQNFPSLNYTSSPIPHIYPQSSTIDDLDYYIVIHSYPPSSQCQKFLCSNDDEVNVMFHCWLYKDIPYDPTISVTEQMNMGIFEPEGISPVHLDLVDSGISFFYMEPRLVELANLQISPFLNDCYSTILYRKSLKLLHM